MSNGTNSNGGVNFGGFNPLSQLEQQSQFQPLPAPHQPGTFRSILGGLASIAGNMFAPGLGSAIGGLIGGNFGGGGGNPFAAGLASSAFAANAANAAQDQQILAVAQQANAIQEMVQLQSSLEKSKHEAFMAVVQNIGS